MERGSIDRVLAAPGLLLLTTLALQACGSAGTPAGTLHSDSAGVAIATALEPVSVVLAAWGRPAAPTTRRQERRIQRSVAVPDALTRAYADGTRSPDGSPGPEYWQLRVDYVIHASLDPSTSVVSGRESIVVHNASDAVLDAVCMRFDQNLFREDAVRRIGIQQPTDGMVVTALSIDGVARPVPSGPETTGRFPLPEPLAPADSILMVPRCFRWVG
ncbi:hypothetical protein [Candidatus Palauibacter sp.]|uniref:hypothetical protein n=1 Tax=Candidatus Palauibacter sp. TaxID=3101350 RepID=UPI003B02E87A